MIYSLWLFGLSLLFLLLERLRPRLAQPVFRRGFFTDFTYLVFNGEYLGVLLGTISLHFIATLDQSLAPLYLGIMSGQPFYLQFLVLFFTFDFAQWGIHILLHRVPFLWRFHQVHHSIEEMDWLSNWRFHFAEVIVYKSLLYLPAAFFGFSPQAMFAFGLANTVMGHFNHSNLRIQLGPVQYFLNGPAMHRWHHTHPDSGPPDRNFGIALSLWDWLFGTAYAPAGQAPNRLGFAGIEQYPGNIIGQTLAPFTASRGQTSQPPRPPGRPQ